jgi:hypothetical protein
MAVWRVYPLPARFGALWGILGALASGCTGTVFVRDFVRFFLGRACLIFTRCTSAADTVSRRVAASYFDCPNTPCNIWFRAVW